VNSPLEMFTPWSRTKRESDNVHYGSPKRNCSAFGSVSSASTTGGVGRSSGSKRARMR
jgi:hypothetical protein